MKTSLNILYLEDDLNDVELVKSLLNTEGIAYQMVHVDGKDGLLAKLNRNSFDVILADYSFPSFDGLAALTLAGKDCPDTPFIFLSGSIGEELAIETLKKGATDYVLKQHMSRLIPAISRALREADEKKKRKQSEEALANKAEELARSTAELEQFAYTASHDLQEPLRMVISYVQLLAKRYKDKLDADANEFIGFAVEGATRMKNLIDNMLSFSRLGMQSETAGQSVDCNLVIKEVLENLKFTIRENNATVTHDPLPTVTGESTQLIQLFQNLISNAIKFRSSEPPNVHIAARAVTDIHIINSETSVHQNRLSGSQSSTENPKSGGWLFSIRDNGIGLEPEYREQIFKIFQRLHARSEYSGTGIGLAICQKIVTRNGGRIWAKSKPGKGSTFYFTIPDRNN